MPGRPRSTPSINAHGLAVVLWLQSGCAVNPATQEPVLLALNERQEIDLGEAGLAVLSVSPGLWSDDSLSLVVNRVGSALGTIAPGPPARYRFYVLDTDQKNAFALPGGMVFVSRGLLAMLEREDELAAVLAHEIGHIAARHASRRAVLNQGYEILSSMAKALSVMFDTDARHSERFFASVLARHSRSQEREADRIAVVMTVSSGYDGTALADVLARLEEGAATGEEILKTHPRTPERRALIGTLAAQLTPGPGQPELSPEAFVRHLDGLPLGPGASLGILDAHRYIARDSTFSLEFPAAWNVELSLSGPVATSPDWGAVISVFPRSGEGPLPGKPRRVGELTVYESREGGMVSERATFTIHKTQYEIAGLWSDEHSSEYRARFDEILESLQPIRCDAPAQFQVPVLRVVPSPNGVEKNIEPRTLEARPAHCG